MIKHRLERALVIIPTFLMLTQLTLAENRSVQLADRLGTEITHQDNRIQAAGLPVALAPLTANGVESEVAGAIADRLLFYLGDHGVFQIIERERMQELMDELGFQASGACDTDECAVQLGRIVGARMMLAGSISLVSNLYTLQVRLVAVQSGEVTHQAVGDARSIESVLLEVCEDVARRLALAVAVDLGLETGGRVARGRLTVTSVPSGSDVRIDGRYIGSTPLTSYVQAGAHQIMLEAEDYHPQLTNVSISEGQSRTVNVQMQQLRRTPRRWRISGFYTLQKLKSSVAFPGQQMDRFAYGMELITGPEERASTLGLILSFPTDSQADTNVEGMWSIYYGVRYVPKAWNTATYLRGTFGASWFQTRIGDPNSNRGENWSNTGFCLGASIGHDLTISRNLALGLNAGVVFHIYTKWMRGSEEGTYGAPKIGRELRFELPRLRLSF